MFEHIVANIICDQFDRTLGRARPADKRVCFGPNQGEGHAFATVPNYAMTVRFALNVDHAKEHGYRNLTVMIFGGGSNYITVLAKLDWNVISLKDLKFDEKLGEDVVRKGKQYTEGETPWVVLSCHDSCWRDGVQRLIWENRERINCLAYATNGWYSLVPIDPAMALAIQQWERARREPGAKPTKLEELDFRFKE